MPVGLKGLQRSLQHIACCTTFIYKHVALEGQQGCRRSFGSYRLVSKTRQSPTLCAFEKLWR